MDGNDNGVVLNGIHSRTGSFTYAKPIEMGVSTYMLSEEEVKAVEMAKNNSYEPEHEKVVKVRFKPTFRRKDKDAAMEEQITLDQVEMVDETEEKAPAPRMSSIGDVTQAEKELILKEETLAGKIAAAESILKMREEARAAEAKEAEKEQDVENTEEPVEEAEIPEPVFMEPVFMGSVFLEKTEEEEEENEEN